MEATLTSPSGKNEPCEIRDLEEEWLCQINFTPSEEGVHTISLKFKGIHFAGKAAVFFAHPVDPHRPLLLILTRRIHDMNLKDTYK